MDHVSDVMAFAINNGDLTKALIFGEDEVPDPELSAEERAALEAVEEHLEEGFVALLKACREALWAQAKGHKALKTLKTSVNRDSTIRARDRVEMPLVVRKSWEASVGFDLIVDDSDNKYHVSAWLWTGKSHRDAVRQALAEGGPDGLLFDGRFVYFDLGIPKEDEPFAAIAERAAAALWPAAKLAYETIKKTRDSG